MNFKLALVAVAAVGVASTAQAADLAKKAPAAANYVKICDAFGAGFFYIPGSDTCLKISGRVYSDIRTGSGDFSRLNHSNSNMYGATRSRTGNTTFTRAAAYEQFDARTATEFGVLRSYINLRERYSTGSTSTEVVLQDGFIQFGGLTAGYTRSQFDFAALGYSFGFDYGAYQTNAILNQLAYTFSFGNGISATLSLEDPSSASTDYNVSRRVQWQGQQSWSVGVASGTPSTTTYGGMRVPDVIAKLAISQAWGSAQIAAAYHDDYSAANGEKAGFAVNGGVEVKLPMIAPGDKVAFGAGYAQGAQGYITAWSQTSTGGIIRWVVPGDSIGEDWALDSNGKIHLTNSWGAMASFHHEFNPKWEANLDLSVGGVDGYKARDYVDYGIQADVRWKPVSGFYIGLGVEYGKIDYSSATIAAHTGNKLKDTDGWTTGLRINRTF